MWSTYVRFVMKGAATFNRRSIFCHSNMQRDTYQIWKNILLMLIINLGVIEFPIRVFASFIPTSCKKRCSRHLSGRLEKPTVALLWGLLSFLPTKTPGFHYFRSLYSKRDETSRIILFLSTETARLMSGPSYVHS